MLHKLCTNHYPNNIFPAFELSELFWSKGLGFMTIMTMIFGIKAYTENEFMFSYKSAVLVLVKHLNGLLKGW